MLQSMNNSWTTPGLIAVSTANEASKTYGSFEGTTLAPFGPGS